MVGKKVLHTETGATDIDRELWILADVKRSKATPCIGATKY